MVFNSLSYAIFIIVVFVLYWLIPEKYRWICLLGVSYYFYFSFKPIYILIMIATTLISYMSALLLEKAGSDRQKRIVLCASVALVVTVLFVFKYLGFAFEILRDVLSLFAIRLNPMTAKLILPVGISFYLFQTLGYIIDVYRGKIGAERHLGYYALFVSFFPQIASGPIGRADMLLPQYKNIHKFDSNKAFAGLYLIIWGVYKKLVVADVLSVYVDNVYRDYSSITDGGTFVLAAIFFSLQIYCDFSGYSDIAIGSAKLLGIDLMENFRSPYLASSVKDFWRRWHISLSTWFRDYLYIPLGGSRCSKFRKDFNLIVTFLVSGIWHGANWTFIVWGLIHGIGQVMENHIVALTGHRDKTDSGAIARMIGRVICTCIVFAFCTLAWVFFRADSVSQAAHIIASMPSGITSIGSYVRNGIGGVGIPGNIRLLYVVMIIGVLFISDLFNYDGKLVLRIQKLPVVPRVIICAAFAAFTIIFAQKGVAAEFVYIQF